MSTRLEAEAREALERLAKLNERSVAAEMRLALRAWLKAKA